MKQGLLIFLLAAGLTFALAWLTPGELGDEARADAVTGADTTPAESTTTPVDNNTTDDGPAPAPTVAPQPAPKGPRALRARALKSVTLGSASEEPGNPFLMQVDMTYWGAAVKTVSLARYRTKALGGAPYPLIQPVTSTSDTGATLTLYQLAARRIVIDEQIVDLQRVPWQLDDVVTAADRHEAIWSTTVVDAEDQPLVRIVRRYVLETNSYELACRQSIENLSGRALTLKWEQYAQGDLPADETYMGDRREMAAGYFDNEATTGQVYTEDSWMGRDNFIEKHVELVKEDQTKAESARPFWPNKDVGGNVQLVWVTMTNRYFAAAAHLPADTSGESPRVEPLGSQFNLGVELFGTKGQEQIDQRGIGLLLKTDAFVLEAEQSRQLDVDFYIGPRSGEVFAAEPYSYFNFDHMLRYTLGCFCTFQWLAKALLWFLQFIHAVVFDWGIAIIILVLIVRFLLHPLTKKSQIQMTKFSKQMQQLKPELDKLKKKYEDDPKRFQQEQMKLMREKGVNPFSMLGCLPMFLQMPIWVALYAMLFFAIEIRHEPAFYGFFQLFGGWGFLADLSSPDNFIPIAEGGFSLPLCGTYIPYAINILPLLMAVFFYLQQKYTTPPAMNEQQEQQQKMMKYMTMLFPIMLYPAPAGLTLYILASSIAGMVDGHYVRKHIKEMEEAGTLFERKPPKKGGLAEKLQSYVEQRQKQIQKAQQRPTSRKGKGGKGRGKGKSR